MQPEAIAALEWAKQDGLLPAIVQDVDTQCILMLGYMSRDALQITLESMRVTFYSRSRRRLWTKGETSGHVLELVSIEADCDNDTLLVQARPRGPTCHLDRQSCFAETSVNFLTQLDALIEKRGRERPNGSYTTQLFESGLRRIAQKVGEEGVETALAAVTQDDEALLEECADLVYHLMVLVRARGMSWADVTRVLAERHRA